MAIADFNQTAQNVESMFHSLFCGAMLFLNLLQPGIPQPTVSIKGSCRSKHRLHNILQQDTMSLKQITPISTLRENFLKAVETNQILIVLDETCSGITEKIPKCLFEAGYCKDGKKIGCAEPKRMAPKKRAMKTAEEMETQVGMEVGYSIPFEDGMSEGTVIKYMTDELLLRELLHEPDLQSYGVIILDEADERTVYTDILFGLFKQMLRNRPDLKLIVTSVTDEAEKFSDFFDSAPIFINPGRRFLVKISHTSFPVADYVEESVAKILHIHLTKGTGDILVFLTGQDEIETAQRRLTERIGNLDSEVAKLIVLPMYENIPSDMEAKIYEPTPPRARKVILTTSIAETSRVVDNIIYVVDTGFCKQNFYEARTETESLVVVPISRSSADRRAGRAGRVAPGKCYRLYTAWCYQHDLEENTVHEIQRVNLSDVILILKALGVDDFGNFGFLDRPSPMSLIFGFRQLYALGALNYTFEVTNVGWQLVQLPMHVVMANELLKAPEDAADDKTNIKPAF